jgi:hypothetical protein
MEIDKWLMEINRDPVVEIAFEKRASLWPNALTRRGLGAKEKS